MARYRLGRPIFIEWTVKDTHTHTNKNLVKSLVFFRNTCIIIRFKLTLEGSLILLILIRLEHSYTYTHTRPCAQDYFSFFVHYFEVLNFSFLFCLHRPMFSLIDKPFFWTLLLLFFIQNNSKWCMCLLKRELFSQPTKKKISQISWFKIISAPTFCSINNQR